MSDCIFCKIAAGELPSCKVFEDKYSCAFFDINPISDGHLLVIPVVHCTDLLDVPPEVAGGVFQTVRRLARPLVELVAAEGLNVLTNSGRCAGQIIDHFHVHLIPRRAGDGLGWRWNTKPADQAFIDSLARKLKSLMA